MFLIQKKALKNLKISLEAIKKSKNISNKILFNNINITTNVIPRKVNNINRKLKLFKYNEMKKIISNTKKFQYNDFEINDLPYNLALIYDKRTYCQYYGSILKNNHNLIFSFCNNKDYNSRIIKIDF